MTLQKQTVGIPVLGLNTLADSKSATAGEFDLVENMFFNKTARGGAMLQKRYGGASLSRTASGAGSITSGSRLATFDSERIAIGSNGTDSDPASIYSYSQQLSEWKQVGYAISLSQGAAPGIGLSAEALGTAVESFGAPDVAVNPAGTRLCAVWKDRTSFTTYVTLIDLATGAKTTVTALAALVGGVNGWVRVVALTSVFIIFWGSTAGTIESRTISYTSNFSGGFGGVTTVANNLNATCKADVIKNGSNDSVLVAYHSTVPDTQIKIVDGTNTVTGTTTNAEIPSQAIGWVNWDFSDNNAYLAFVSAVTGAKVFTVSSAPAVTATTTMDATVTAAANVTGFKAVSGSRYHVFIEVRAAATYNCLIRRWPGSGATTSVFQRSCGLGGACFKVTSSGMIRFYLPLAYDSSLQSAYYLRDVSSPSSSTLAPIVGRALYGLGGGLSITGSNVGNVAALSTTVIGMIVPKLFVNPTGTKVFGISLLRFDFAAASVSGARKVGENLHFSGGTTRAYDGSLSAEIGFYVFPEAPTLAEAGGGALTLLGSYQYAVVYAWADGRGQMHRSAPAPVASITLTGANQMVAWTSPTLRLSDKDGFNTGASRVFLEIYRTVASGTTFYRLAVLPVNSRTADTVTANDQASDASISGNEILYTTGKVLPHIGPAMARLMETWRNRLFLAGTENPLELWVSNEYSPGLGGVSFSDALVISMESEGGPITALCEMDDRLVIFKRNSVYVLTGNGPTLTGDNQYHLPTRLTATIGAVEQRGVVKTRDGVMFKSTRGIHLLSHDGQIVYVGAGVDTYNSLTVSGACVLDDEEQVRFTTIEGRTLVYHYGFPGEDGVGRWTTFTNQPAVDCIVWNGKYVFLKSDGTVVEETVGTYVDPGSTSINAKVRWAWLSLTQFFGRFKLYGVSILGDFLASFTLTHRLAYDYDTAIAESETKAVTAATLPPLKLSPARRRAVAIQPTLEETSTTQGFTVSGLGLEVGVEPGAAKFGTDKFLT